MKEEWSVEEQKDLFQRLGYDVSRWNPEDQKEKDKVFQLAIEAQLNGVDARHKPLSADDFVFLSIITGRG